MLRRHGLRIRYVCHARDARLLRCQFELRGFFVRLLATIFFKSFFKNFFESLFQHLFEGFLQSFLESLFQDFLEGFFQSICLIRRIFIRQLPAARARMLRRSDLLCERILGMQ